MKSTHQQRVEEFMWQAKQEIPAEPTMPSVETRLLRAKLIMEEALETIELGLGLNVHWVADGNSVKFYMTVATDREPSLIEIADGCADLSVVTTGTLSACGIPDGPILEAVDANNLEKFAPGHYWNEAGKLIKPPGHKPPNIAEILARINRGDYEA